MQVTLKCQASLAVKLLLSLCYCLQLLSSQDYDSFTRSCNKLSLLSNIKMLAGNADSGEE